jgi:hypothetical protein
MGRRHQDMWKLRLSILLPAVQLPLAVIPWEWGGRLHHPTLGAGHWRAGPLVCYGINAPAIFLRLVVFPFTRGGRPWPHPSIFGYGPEELSFFLGVAILWFVVGKLPDRRRSDKVSSEKRVTGSRGFNKFFYDRFRNSHGNRPLCRGSGRASDSL